MPRVCCIKRNYRDGIDREEKEFTGMEAIEGIKEFFVNRNKNFKNTNETY